MLNMELIVHIGQHQRKQKTYNKETSEKRIMPQNTYFPYVIFGICDAT